MSSLMLALATGQEFRLTNMDTATKIVVTLIIFGSIATLFGNATEPVKTLMILSACCITLYVLGKIICNIVEMIL
jgi:hypothetical protein